MSAVQVPACIAAELSPTRILCPWNELRGPEQKGWSRHGVRPHRPKEKPQHPMCPRAAGWSWPCAAATQLPPPPTPISSICFQSQHHPNPFGRTPPPDSPCYQMPLFFQGADARHLLVSMHLPRAARASSRQHPKGIGRENQSSGAVVGPCPSVPGLSAQLLPAALSATKVTVLRYARSLQRSGLRCEGRAV